MSQEVVVTMRVLTTDLQRRGEAQSGYVISVEGHNWTVEKVGEDYSTICRRIDPAPPLPQPMRCEA